jgi:hypothetical protein
MNKRKPTVTRSKKAEWAWEHLEEVNRERDLLVRALSLHYPSHLSDYSSSRTKRQVVCIHTPAGQIAWTVPDDLLDSYKHLQHTANDWDKHKTADRIERLARLVK